MGAYSYLCQNVAQIVLKAAVFNECSEGGNFFSVGRVIGYDLNRINFGVLSAQKLEKMIGVIARVNPSFGYNPKVLILL